METSLVFEKDRKLYLRTKERFGEPQGLSLLMSGSLCTTDGRSRIELLLRQRVVLPKGSGIRVDAFARSASDAQAWQPAVGVAAVKSLELSSDGLLRLEAHGSAEARGPHYDKLHSDARVELKQTIWNFNRDQDLQVTLGYDLVKRDAYATLRENAWTLHGKAGRWSIEYAL